MKKWSIFLKSLIKQYPIPAVTFCGLFLGIVAFLLEQKNIAHILWLIVLVVCGAPIVFNTLKGMFKGKFASDVVAMLAIDSCYHESIFCRGYHCSDAIRRRSH